MDIISILQSILKGPIGGALVTIIVQIIILWWRRKEKERSLPKNYSLILVFK
jgi:hypothetical protein